MSGTWDFELGRGLASERGGRLSLERGTEIFLGLAEGLLQYSERARSNGLATSDRFQCVLAKAGVAHQLA